HQVTTTTNNLIDENETTEFTSHQFRDGLAKSLMKDKVLIDIVTKHIVESYSNDLIRTFCLMVEKNFTYDLDKNMKTIEFVSRWLQLKDEYDYESFNVFPNKHIWLLAHVYTTFEYDQNDLLSLYSAFRITDHLQKTSSSIIDLSQENDVTRSQVRENLFTLMFDYLWNNLYQLCSNNDNSEQWIHIYSFISKYYPSNKVLGQQPTHIKNQIEFMNLAYLIFLNDKIPEPKKLLSHLLNDTNLIDSNFKQLPTIIQYVNEYFTNQNINSSALMIDLQQWIISILKASKKSCKQEINYLLNYLNQSTCQLTLTMKQFLFDELAKLSLEYTQKKHSVSDKPKFDYCDRIVVLLPIVIECISDEDLPQDYQLLYHPSIVSNNNNELKRQPLLDLLFFHIKRFCNDVTNSGKLVHKTICLDQPAIKGKHHISVGQNIFTQLKNYFLLRSIALLLCETDLDEYSQDIINDVMPKVIKNYLSINQEDDKLNNHLQLFVSTIISKYSWNFLLNLLKSDRIQILDSQWATSLSNILELKQISQTNNNLHLCHKIQFTISPYNDISSIFPDLHQSYDELSIIFDRCIKDDIQEQRWITLSNWIQCKLNIDEQSNLKRNEIKAMILLKIYYDYYCNNQLALVDTLLDIIENMLELSSDELRIFRAIFKPEQFMIGYPNNNNNNNNNEDSNFLNSLFKLDYKVDDEVWKLSIRHLLVNLMAMILMEGQQSFLWTFALQPLTLEHTFGFGSMRSSPIKKYGIHYDCGCILTHNGDLVRFMNDADEHALSVPAIYVVLFSTFGAMAWHLLLFDTSIENLCGRILSTSAIKASSAGNSDRAKACHFITARLLSTFHFLAAHLNEDDACILLSRCFEQMALMTINQQNSWIKSIYSTLEDKLEAEKEYQIQIFYPVYQKLAAYRSYINHLNLQSQMQANLRDFINQLPITVQFKHFKTELHNPSHSELPLKILEHVLDSIDFLKMTKHIYDLGQFYLLLHQTYTQLIERDEFLTIDLHELVQRGQKHYNHCYHHSEKKNHSKIIENGLNAINTYHSFTGGLIRPGACDETQYFETVTPKTPVHYLVTTGNHDEGDIIMRILSNNTGVITLTDNNYSWIEQLCQASLMNKEEYFPTSDTQFNFDFLYVQSYIIRTYLLFCRINYRHIAQKYQCHIRQTQITTTTIDTEIFDLGENYSVLLNSEQLEIEWNHLKDMLLDKLYHSNNLLRQISRILKHHPEDVSFKNLYDFIESTDRDTSFRDQLEKYEIKNFQLCYIQHIRKLYENSINGFEYLFTDVSDLLRIPIDDNLKHELKQIFDTKLIQIDYNTEIDQLNLTIQSITQLLNELKSIQDTLSQQSTQSLTIICEHLNIINTILSLIPESIKCENYVTLCIILIQLRSTLQEQTINIEEKKMKLWNENFDLQSHQQGYSKEGNRFHNYLKPDNNQTTNSSDQDDWNLLDGNYGYSGGYMNDSDDLLADDYVLLTPQPENTTIPIQQIYQKALVEQKLEYVSIFELSLKFVPLASTVMTQQLLNKQQQVQMESANSTKAIKFFFIHPDSKSTTHLTRSENLYEQLKKIVKEKKYNLNTLAIINKNEIFVDLMTNSSSLPNQISSEYRILEKTLLVHIQFQFQTKLFEYWTTLSANISTLIDCFIDDSGLKSTSPDVCFCFTDELGKCIDNGTIADIYQTNDNNNSNTTIYITVTEENSNTANACEVTLRSKQDDMRQSVVNYLSTDNQLVHFRISILIQIFKYDEKQQKQKHQQITISDRNMTIEQLLLLTKTRADVVAYLASNNTQVIIESHKQLLNLNETEFILVEEYQTCLVSIKKPKELQLIEIDEGNELNTRFIIFATIDDVYRYGKIDVERQHLLYSDDFVPTINAQLVSFRLTSPIRFTLMDGNLPMTITILNVEGQSSIKFHCLISITIKRLYQIACQLFNINDNFLQLIYSDCSLDDDEMTLEDLDPTSTDIQLQLICKATLKSSITYHNETVIIPCDGETLATDIIEEAFRRFCIPQEHMDIYELLAKDSDTTQIDSIMSIEDILQLFPSDTVIIPFELIKKEE
ncbi:unnamed protein product, partial [Rotaria sordida]